MTTQERKKLSRMRHLVELKQLGYMPQGLGKINGIERRAHKFAEDCCNTEVPESTQDKKIAAFTEEVKQVFDGVLPSGFFINMDARGYALKLDDTAYSRDPRSIDKMPLSYTDFGGYGILAPEF